jgi:hypothetical protein
MNGVKQANPVDVQPADPIAQRRALIAVIAIAAAGIAAWFVLEDWLMGLQAADPLQARHAMKNALIWGTWAASLPVILLAAHLWRSGEHVRRAERYPPPGAKLVRDTPILTGSRARTRGTALQVLGVFLCLATVGLLFAVYRLAALLDQARPSSGSGLLEAAAAARGAGSTAGGSSLYITGVTSRASSVELTSPPMITTASGE